MKKTSSLFLISFFVFKSVFAQWTTDTLSAATYNLVPVQIGTKAIFCSGSKFETYDFATSSWSSRATSLTRSGMRGAAAGNKVYFAGGGFITVNIQVVYKNIDIYNNATNTWSTANLSQARFVGASAAVRNKLLFAGGRQVLAYSNRVDMYDVVTGAARTYTLSQSRHNMAVATVGNKVIFAGGECGSIINAKYVSSNKVDIYDDSTGTWSTALLSLTREQICTAVVGNKVIFAGGLNNSGAGGQYSNRVDIYDASTNTWSVASLSETKYGMASAVVGNKAYFVGGTINNSGALTNRVEIYDASTNTWSYTTISAPRMSMCVGQTPQRVMFAGGVEAWGNTGSSRVEVLNLSTNTWSVESLSQPRLGVAAASYGNKVLFAGGAQVVSSYPQYSIISNKVDIWTGTSTGKNYFSSLSNISTDNNSGFNVFPNPSTGNSITVNFKNIQSTNARISIIDVYGRMVRLIKVPAALSFSKQIDVSGLLPGNYFVQVESGNKKECKTLIIAK